MATSALSIENLKNPFFNQEKGRGSHPPPPIKISIKRRIFTRKGDMVSGARVLSCCYLIPYHSTTCNKRSSDNKVYPERNELYIYLYIVYQSSNFYKKCGPKISNYFLLKGRIGDDQLVHFLRKQEMGCVVGGGGRWSWTSPLNFPPIVLTIDKVKYRAKWTGILCSLFTS